MIEPTSDRRREELLSKRRETPMTSRTKNWIAVLAIFSMSQTLGAVDSSLADMAAAFHISFSTALYCSTVASLVAVFSCMLAGVVVGRRLSYRTVALASAILLVVGGVLPMLAGRFAVLLVFRGVFGLGIGGMMSLQTSTATTMVEENARSKILGIGTACAFAMTGILQYVGGVLAREHWNRVFLTHLLLLIPLALIVICMPKGKDEALAGKEKKKAHPRPLAIIICLMWGICSVVIAPLLIGCSFLSSAITPSTVIAGIVAACFTLGNMIGGLLFPFLYKLTKRRSLPTALVIAAVGMFGCTAARVIPLLCISMLIAGIGMANLCSSIMIVLGLISDPESISLVSSLLMASQCIFTFLSSSWATIIGNITGDALYTPIRIGVLIYLIFAVIQFIRSPFPKAENAPTESS